MFHQSFFPFTWHTLFGHLSLIQHLHGLLCVTLCLPTSCWQIVSLFQLLLYFTFVETLGINVWLFIYHLNKKCFDSCRIKIFFWIVLILSVAISLLLALWLCAAVKCCNRLHFTFISPIVRLCFLTMLHLFYLQNIVHICCKSIKGRNY